MANIEDALNLLSDEDQPYPARLDALEELLGVNDRRVVDAVLRALTSQERYLRRKAAEVLAQFDVPQVIYALGTAASSDADEAVRRNAVRSLGHFSDPSALDALYRAAKDESLIVSKEAETVLQKVRGARAEVAQQERARPAAPAAPPVVEKPPRVPAETPAPVPAPPPPATAPAPKKPKRKRPAKKREPTPEQPKKEDKKAETVAPAPPVSPVPETEPLMAPPPAGAKGYVPPALARVPALRGLSASEELGWPDLLRAFMLSRRSTNLILSALGLALAFSGNAFIVCLFGGEPFPLSLANARQPGLCLGAVGLWTWLVWSAVGLAVSRNVAVQLATGEELSTKELRHFWVRHLIGPYRPTVLAVLLVAAPLALIWLAGWLSALAVWGGVIGAVSYHFCLLAAFLVVLMVLGLIAGIPMMVPAIVVENTGCADAITSSWAYVFACPWRYMIYWVAAFVHGAFVVGVVVATVCLAQIGMAAGAGREISLSPVDHLVPALTPLGIVHIAILVALGAYILSHYFTSRVGIYLLMRKAVDGIDVDAVHLPGRKSA